MQWIRLMVGALLAGACACTSNADRPRGSAPATGTTGAGGSPAPQRDAADGTNPVAKDAGRAPVEAARIDAAEGASDGPIVVVHNDASLVRTACASDLATLGSSRLVAGLSTPPAFAAAYNEERVSLNSPGPFLLALTGVNETAASGWTAIFGPLAKTAQGAATFAGPRAQVPFAMGIDRAIDIAETSVQFDLAFTTSGGATLPVTAVKLSGTLANACSSLSVTSLELLVPANAGTISFHGSTVGDLMRSGSSGSAAQGPWPLELSGLAQQVYAVGVVDAGAEP
jgi:hypothetical protein